MPTLGTINPCYYYPMPLLKSCRNIVIGFILVLFGFRWILICSLQVFRSQEKPTKTKIKPCQSLALLSHATIKFQLQHCDRFYLGFIRFSLIPYLLVASVLKPRKPSKTNINPLLSFRMVAAIGGGHCNNSTIQNEKYWRKVKSQDNGNSMKEKAKRSEKGVGRREKECLFLNTVDT